jgi:hypothetical protein
MGFVRVRSACGGQARPASAYIIQVSSFCDFHMPPKSKFRQPGAQHFQLVHRSQRDPLINDPDASAHVLKPFERDNVKKVIYRHFSGPINLT